MDRDPVGGNLNLERITNSSFLKVRFLGPTYTLKMSFGVPRWKRSGSPDLRIQGQRGRCVCVCVFTCIVGQGPSVLVEHEPALLPGFDLAAHLDQEAPAGLIGDGEVEAGVWVMPRLLDVAVEVKVVFPHREVPRQHP